MKNYAVIFDMDGVISHTNPYHAKAFEAFFKNYNIQSTEEEFEKHLYGKHNSYIMQHFFKRAVSKEELRDLEFEKEQLFRVLYKDKVAAIKNYLPFLESLKKANFKTGVATSAPRANMDLIIDSLGIRHQMESLLASEDVSLHKPHPEVYLKSAEALAVAVQDCIVFEDSFSGITAALQAGMKVVGVLTTHSKEQLPICDAYIQDYTVINVAMLIDMITQKPD